jgi:hypothetical protein
MNLIGDQMLASVLRREPDPMLETPGLVVLPPAGSRVPLLQLAHGIEHDQEVLRMTIVVVGSDHEGPHAMAWRFETPEGPGQHCYWHCQPVTQLRGSQPAPLDRLPPWCFDDMPTIPLPARNADELLVALLVSVYGHSTLGRMQRQDFQDRLQAPLAALDIAASTASQRGSARSGP